MADLAVGQHWLVSPDTEVEKQWVKVAINERLSRVKATQLQIDDLSHLILSRRFLKRGLLLAKIIYRQILNVNQNNRINFQAQVEWPKK